MKKIMGLVSDILDLMHLHDVQKTIKYLLELCAETRK